MTIITIQSGDTLYTIGKRYGVTVDQIASANGIDPRHYLVIGDSLIIPSPEEQVGSLQVNGFAYPFIDRDTLKKSLPYLTFLSLFSYGFEKSGKLIELRGDLPLIQMAKEAGVAPLLVLTTVDKGGEFSSRRAADLLQDPEAQHRLAVDLKNALEKKGYYGLNVDMEYIPAALAKNYVDFIAYLKKELSPRPIFVSLAPKTDDGQHGLLFDGHDYEKLGDLADGLFLMTYEWGHTFGPPMAIAPLDQVEQVIGYAQTKMDANKILMSLPNYGYDWTLPYQKDYPARSVSNAEAVSIARKYGAQIQYDHKAQAPYFNYYDRYGRQHRVWYEDARSYRAKLDFAHQQNLGGISVWNIMRFYQPLFTLIDSSFHIAKIPKDSF